jgi:serine/threonine protein phosphatase PrpC
MKSIRPRRADLKGLKLSAEDGFVLSRIVGPLTLRELVAISGMEEKKVVEIVERLAAQGAVEIERDASFAEPVRDPVPSFAGIDELDGITEEEQEDDEPETPALMQAPPPKRPSVPLPIPPGIKQEKKEEKPPSRPSSIPPAATRPASSVALEVAGATDVGRVRTNNEDSFTVLDLGVVDAAVVDVSKQPHASIAMGQRGALLAVADGMGGENAGEVASKMVVDTLRELLAGSGAIKKPADLLREAVEAANARVVEAGVEPKQAGMGATVVALLLVGTAAYTAEVGDSRAYLLRGGKLTQLTKDQTYTSLLVEQGVLTEEDAKKSHAKHVVLQACGKASDIVVAQRRLELRRGDVLLLCSDGLSGQVSDEDVKNVLVSKKVLSDACAELIAKANEHKGDDNVTVVAARVAGLSLPAARADEEVADTVTVIRPYALPT